jgi:hypothetical protein
VSLVLPEYLVSIKIEKLEEGERLEGSSQTVAMGLWESSRDRCRRLSSTMEIAKRKVNALADLGTLWPETLLAVDKTIYKECGISI